MALAKKEEARVSAKVFCCLSTIVAVVLLVVGVCAWKTGSSAVSMVNQGLTEQKIYFPPAGSPAFAEAAFPAAQKYAGKQVVDGALAKAYAEDFLGVQLKLLGNGKVSSEVAADLAADPQNPMLQQLQATMFQIETSKTLMLSSAYGASVQGTMIKNLGAVALAAAAVLALVAVSQCMRYMRLK